MKARLCLCGFLLIPLGLFAQKKLGEAATIQKVEIQGDAIPGGRITVVVKVHLEKDYHVHSNKPSDPDFIATLLSLQTPAGVRVGSMDYPKGKLEKAAGLDKPLSVYEEQFQISVPLGLSASAKLPMTIPATLSYQACQGAHCFTPQTLKFDIALPGAR